MPIPVTNLKSDDDQMTCPITGDEVYGPDGVRDVPSLLFVHIGDADSYLYISERLVTLLLACGVDCDSEEIPISPAEVADRLDLEGGKMIEVDSGWNGINCYGFAPPE